LLGASGWAHAQNVITHYEYWFDQNDADASRTLVALSTPASTIQLFNETIDLSALPVGPHFVHYRLRDTLGKWSSVLRRDLQRNHDAPHEIVALRYWSEPDAIAPSDMTEVPINPGAQYLDLVDDILFCEWSATDSTNVYFQLMDNHAQWSSVVSRSINVDTVSSAPEKPDAILGLFDPPFNSEQNYTIVPVLNAGVYEWTLPTGWTGVSNTTMITTQVGNINDGSLLCVRAINGCGESDTTCFDITTQVANLTASIEIGLYPNPNTGQFFLELKNTAQVVVFDASGRQITSEQVLRGIRHSVELGNASNGVYTVRIIQDDLVEVLRFVVKQ